MNRILTALKIASLTAVICLLSLLCLVTFTVYRGLVSGHANQLGTSLSGLNALVGKASPAADSAVTAMRNLSAASSSLNTAAQNETQFLQTQSRQFALIIHDAKAIIVHTDQSLNDPYRGTLPAARDALVGTADLERHTVDAIDLTSSNLQPALSDFAAGAHEFELALSDPAVIDTLHHIDISTQSFEGVTADLHTETTLLVGATKKAVVPTNKLLHALEESGGGAVTILEILYYLTHQ